MAKVKLIDVARLAAVSKSTASQYLNGRFDYMSKETQERQLKNWIMFLIQLLEI